MTTDALAAHILADPAALTALVAPLDDAAVADLVEHFKSEADRHWWINANRSLEFAELIIRIGRQRDDLRHIALGTMARGDALKYLGNLQEAWDELESAGNMFMDAGDAAGWARTRIGRLPICVDLKYVEEALLDAARAHNIFEQHGNYEKLLRLQLNTAIVYAMCSNHIKARTMFEASLTNATELGEQGKKHLGIIHTNIGYECDMLGDLHLAKEHYDLASKYFTESDEKRGIAMVDLNKAHIEIVQGNYNKALLLLDRAYRLYVQENLPRDAIDVLRDSIECSIQLNRFEDARRQALEVINYYHNADTLYQKAVALGHLAICEVQMENIEEATKALSLSENIFTSLNSEARLSNIYLLQGRIFLQQGDIKSALKASEAAYKGFTNTSRKISQANALLLKSQISLLQGDSNSALKDALTALNCAILNNVPSLRYSAHFLLGQIAQKKNNIRRAQRHYSASICIIERWQSALTIALRTDFLTDKSEAMRSALALHLQENNNANAFITLERTKSQAMLGYLSGRGGLRWSYNDTYSRELIEELTLLREEHHWYYRLAHEPLNGANEPHSNITPKQARTEVTVREKRMRAITEQLYLQGGDNVVQVKPPKLRDVQAALGDDELLIEFYNDGATLYAFTIDQHTLAVERFAATVSEVDGLIAQLQANIGFALSVSPRSSIARQLNGVAKHLLDRLYTSLLAPLAERLCGRQRLTVVPYGTLHYLPFHLLHDGTGYLIEQHEVVVLPAAGLLTRRGPTRSTGALVLAHSWAGRLPHTQHEAQIVQALFGGNAYAEEGARRAILSGEPGQILHIAAHGEHRLDQPDLSFIELADGQLYTDDLLQLDMSYELVVLSACETGRAKVAAGDELIGLGRGFLYAGAGAIVASLWRVTDDTTVALMQHFYANLRAGMSKAAALRYAQLAILAEQPDLHPAFWGAFQLVGDTRPLTGFKEGHSPYALSLSTTCWPAADHPLHHPASARQTEP